MRVQGFVLQIQGEEVCVCVCVNAMAPCEPLECCWAKLEKKKQTQKRGKVMLYCGTAEALLACHSLCCTPIYIFLFSTYLQSSYVSLMTRKRVTLENGKGSNMLAALWRWRCQRWGK